MKKKVELGQRVSVLQVRVEDYQEASETAERELKTLYKKQRKWENKLEAIKIVIKAKKESLEEYQKQAFDYETALKEAEEEWEELLIEEDDPEDDILIVEEREFDEEGEEIDPPGNL